MTFLDRLEKSLGRFAIPGLIRYVVALNALVFLLITFEPGYAAVLELDRDPAKLRADVLEMRGTMAAHKPAKGPLDVKLARGGLVDIEFIVHYLQLRDHRALVPSIAGAVAALVEAGQIDPAMAEAHAVLGRFLIAARLLLPEGEEPPFSARAVLASACECADWTCLTDKLAESRRRVAAAWSATFGEPLEID